MHQQTEGAQQDARIAGGDTTTEDHGALLFSHLFSLDLDLSSLRMMCTTGSPLLPEGFDYVYGKIKSDIHLVSFSGGTVIMGIFCGGDPTRPVWRGEIQAPMLGVALEVFDGEGNSTKGEKGELVCTKGFPSMPVGFWDDDDGKHYHAAYFEAYPNVWTHGD